MYIAKCEKKVECLLSSMRFIASYGTLQKKVTLCNVM